MEDEQFVAIISLFFNSEKIFFYGDCIPLNEIRKFHGDYFPLFMKFKHFVAIIYFSSNEIRKFRGDYLFLWK